MAWVRHKRLLFQLGFSCFLVVDTTANEARQQGWRFAILEATITMAAATAILLILCLWLLRKQHRQRERRSEQQRLALSVHAPLPP